MEEVCVCMWEGGGGSERLLKNCRNKGNELGWAKNTAQRVNTIKDYTRGR